MGTYASIYTDSPTSGGTDGTALSEDSAQTSPLSVTLDATNAESSVIKCAIRCTDGYESTGDITLAFSGDDDSRWSIAADDSYDDADAAEAGATFSTSLTISDTIDATNTIFWVKATSSTDESPESDTSVSLTASGTIEAASS